MLFIGDSTLKHIAEQVAMSTLKQCRVHKKCNRRCSFQEYLNLSPVKQYVRARDMNRKFCDAKIDGCRSFSCVCENRSMEYVANLVTYNNAANLVIEKYLDKAPRDLCVVGSGMHEQHDSNYTTHEYENDVKAYLQRLDNYCGQMIWLSINAVRGYKQYNQSNRRIVEWNKAIRGMLRSDLPNVAFIDVFPMSTKGSMHWNRDNVHMNDQYNRKVASFFDI